MLELPLTTTSSPKAPDDQGVGMKIQLSVRRGSLAMLVGVATVSVVLLTLFMARGKELTRFNRQDVDAAEEKKLLDRYNSYSGSVASALGRPLEVFVTMMAQLLMLWLMTDSVMRFQASWRVRLTVLALSASVGFLLTSSLNALNVQVRKLPPTLVMKASDLSVEINATNSSTLSTTFSEQTPRNPSTNTILRSLILPRASIKSMCSPFHRVLYGAQYDSITYGMPQRPWMKSFLPEALPASTVRIDLLTNKTTNGTANDLQTNASIIADLLISGVHTNSTYAPFEFVTAFNMDNNPLVNSARYRTTPCVTPTARLAGLLPPDPQSAEAQDRTWLFARTSEFMRRATSDERLNSSTLLRWTLDVSRINITSHVWVDGDTIESEVLLGDISVPFNGFTTSSGIHLLEADARYPDAQVHTYAVCLNGNGTETLTSELARIDIGNGSYETSVICQSTSNSSMNVFGSGRHFVTKIVNYTEIKWTAGFGSIAILRDLRVVSSATFARISWQPQDLSSAYNATCDVDGGCMGLDASLSDANQRLLVNANALPLDQLTPVRYTAWETSQTYSDPQQPFEVVSDGFRGNKTEWDAAQSSDCSAVLDRRVLNYVITHLYIEKTLQATYTAAAFFLFQNGIARDVLSQSIPMAATRKNVPLKLDGNIQETSVWLSVPKLNAMFTLAGCGSLVVGLVVALVRLHSMTTTQDHKLTVSAPHQIARVMVDDTTFPSLLLKRYVDDNGVTDDADQFVIDTLTVRSIRDTEARGSV